MSGSLDHSPAQVLAELLVDLGLATAVSSSGSWPAYVSVLPDSPDEAIAITNTQGKHDGRSMTDGTVYEHYGYQVLARSLSDANVWGKVNAIAIAFDGVERVYVPLGSTTYRIQAISRLSTPLFIGYDDASKRRMYSLNGFVCMRQMTGTGSY